MAKHENSGRCAKCGLLFNRFPKFNGDLRLWFEKMQNKYPDFHISEAGRGHLEQEACKARGASRAGWKQSAHNYNAAIDTFFLVDGKYSLDERLFEKVVKTLPEAFSWYGSPKSSFYERPHFELANWKELASSGVLKLVEADGEHS